ncbi:MAG: NAD(P)H-hydrate dehydratase [Lachnospiraceae bacterium]|nr:NAD(P)H-hydrate dehydratase [Lachnospiraceae bacterium]
MSSKTNIRVKWTAPAMQEVRAIREEEERKRLRPSRLNDRSFARLLPNRLRNGNKGTFGKALIVAGSRNMAGAAILSARAALSSGCGMVMVLTDECNRVILQTAVPEAILATYDGQVDEEVVQNAMDWATCMLIGPGLSMNDTSKYLVDFVLDMPTSKPIVVDADALNILSEEANTNRLAEKSVIVTPHVGEMGRLVGLPVSEIHSHMIETAEAFSTHHGVTVVLKDAVSVISSPGRRTFENHSGNSGMATAGSGDVLAGLIVGLLAQGMKNPDAAILGAYMHGRAGDFAAEEKTEYCMMASDIIRHFPKVFALAGKRDR